MSTGTRVSGGRWGGWALAVPLLLLAAMVTSVTPSSATTTPAFLFATPAGRGTQTCANAANACTLSKALIAAGPGTTIDLVTAGSLSNSATWYEGGFSVDTPGTSAAKPVTINGESHAIIDGDQSQVDLTVGPIYLDLDDVSIDGSGNGPGLRNNDGGSVTVENSTFTGDTNSGNYGGAIDNSDTLLVGTIGRDTLTVINSTFSSDSALEGGAIFNEDGTVDVAGSTFTSDEADADGGGAIMNGFAVGVHAPAGTLVVTSSIFENNIANVVGGAIDNADGATGTSDITDSTFSDNISGNYGGAVSNGYSGGSGSMDVSESTFNDDQTATNGGGIDNGDDGAGTLQVLHSTFNDDVASGNGTGIDSADNGGSGSTTVGGDIFNDTCYHSSGGWLDLGYNVGRNASCFNASSSGNVDDATLYADVSGLEQLHSPLPIIVPSAGGHAASTIPNGVAQLCPVAGDERGMPSPGSGPCDAGAAQVPGGATVQLLASPLPATTGAVTYNVVVQGSLGLEPAGSVQIVDNHSGHCEVTLLVSDGSTATHGSCALTESAATSPYTVTATYVGNANYGESSTSIVEQGTVAGSSGAATTTNSGITVTGTGGKSGSSEVSEAKYASDPEPTKLASGSTYFDVAEGKATSGAADAHGTAAFAAVKVLDCDKVTSTSRLYWWGTKHKRVQWLPVVGNRGPTYVKGKSACLTVTLTSASSPTVAELTGTPFATTRPRLQITGSTIIDAHVHRFGRVLLPAAGGSAPYTWRLLIGTLPKLLKLGSNGVLSGTPEAAGTTTVVVQVTDTATSTTPQAHVIATLQIVVLPLAPTVKSIDPASGSPKGGTRLTIDGTHLAGASAVYFGGTAASKASFKVNAAATVLMVTAPAHAAGKVDVTVTTRGGTSNAGSYKYT